MRPIWLLLIASIATGLVDDGSLLFFDVSKGDGAAQYQMVINPSSKQRGFHSGDPWVWQLSHPFVERAPGPG
jgi:hypothetical protein